MDTVPLDSLAFDEANTNRHTQRGREMTRKSVAKFQPRKPLELDRNGVVIDGNDRLSHYDELGIEQVKVIDAQPGEVLAVRYPDFDLSDPDNPAREYQIAQARSGQLSLEFDPPMLELAAENIDLSDWFKGYELDLLMGDSGQSWGDTMGQLPDGDRAPFQQMTFTLSDEQAEQVKRALEVARKQGAFVDTGNENGNGNALARVCETFLTDYGNG